MEYWATEYFQQQKVAVDAVTLYNQAMKQTLEDPRLASDDYNPAFERATYRHEGMRSGIDHPELERVYQEHAMGLREREMRGLRGHMGRLFNTKGHQNRLRDLARGSVEADAAYVAGGQPAQYMDRVKDRYGWASDPNAPVDFDTEKAKVQKARWFRQQYPEGSRPPSLEARVRRQKREQNIHSGDTTQPTIDARERTETMAPHTAGGAAGGLTKTPTPTPQVSSRAATETMAPAATVPKPPMARVVEPGRKVAQAASSFGAFVPMVW